MSGILPFLGVNPRVFVMIKIFFPVKSQIVKKLGIETNYSILVPSREHLLSFEPKTAADLPPR